MEIKENQRLIIFKVLTMLKYIVTVLANRSCSWLRILDKQLIKYSKDKYLIGDDVYTIFTTRTGRRYIIRDSYNGKTYRKYI